MHPTVIAETSRIENVVASVLTIVNVVNVGHLYNAKNGFYYRKNSCQLTGVSLG
jgi:hypothetical protein